MNITVILSGLASLSFALLLWQFVLSLRFPLHTRVADRSFAPAITLLKPLKNFDEYTEACLRSWLTLDYGGPVQILFGVADEEDPVCFLVRKLLKEFPNHDAELIVARESLGPNAKISTVAQLYRRASHDVICVSDADVRVAPDFLANTVAPLRDASTGLVNCFYRLANPNTFAMRIESIAVNADFWSQVLQSNALKSQNFALGAVMVTRREQLNKIGAFESLLEFLADDYRLGNEIAKTGKRIELAPVVVECWDKPMGFREVWKHQLRWARTIHACQPWPYFFSILGNTTLWAGLLALFGDFGSFPLVPDSVLSGHVFSSHVQDMLAPVSVSWVLMIFAGILLVRTSIAAALQRRFTRQPHTARWWFVVAKDFLNVAVWAVSFLGNTIEWRGKQFRLSRGGRLVPLPARESQGRPVGSPAGYS